ncbi:MAG: type I secretion C-terminal target domain-containing protein [Burkholderiaceae bacterium]|nr:type I secretion C-terminal target domain-containing protein [Burkholderiaceae bacterium]
MAATSLTLVRTSPTYSDTEFGVSANVVLTFSTAVLAGSGNITIKDSSGQTIAQENIANSSRITISGDTVTLDLPADLAYGASYHLSFPATLVKDSAGNTLSYGANQHFNTELNPAPVTAVGTPGRDTLTGGRADDRLDGGDGEDELNGYAGNDVLNGGNESNGAGDRIKGGDGNDTMHGNGGDDVLWGDAGNDSLYGDEGKDSLYGGNGDDLLDGGDGDDRLEDSNGHNQLRGGGGDDSFESLVGDGSVLDGGDGNDFFRGSGKDNVDGGNGDDRILLIVSSFYNSSATVLGGAGNDSVEIRFQGEGASRVTASGGQGSDRYLLNTGIAATTYDYRITDFMPGSGGDLIDLEQVMNWMGASNPFKAGGYLRLYQDGADTLLQRLVPGSQTDYYTMVRLQGIAPSQLSAANFVGGIDPHGSSQGQVLTGTGGDDTLRGNAMDDKVYGLAGADTLSGNAGNDLLDGGDGADQLWGGDGDDTLLGGDSNDRLDGGAGNDTLDGGAGNDELNDLGGSNTLRGGAGDDRMVALTEGSSVFDGGDGNDQITAGYGNDAVTGGAGSDHLTIHSGWDLAAHAVQVDGGEGNDIIEAEIDTNAAVTVTARGGAGADRFVFSRGTTGNGWTIADFNAEEGDRIDLSPILPADTGGNPFGASGYLRAVQRGGDTVISYDADGVGGTNAGMAELLVLKGVQLSTLSAAAFTGNLNPAGGSTGNVITGTAGDDALTGTALNDTIMGGAGRDSIDGGGGADMIDGGADADTLSGGVGDDRIEGGAGSDILNGGTGNDTLLGGAGLDQLNGGAGNDSLDGGEENDYLSDDAGNNVLSGGAGDDTLSSTSTGASRLDGGAGDDIFYAGAGNDTLFGGAGNDSISITGNDGERAVEITLSGGDGNDVVEFRSGRTATHVVVSGGQGSDTYRLLGASSTLTLTVEDFSAGAGGDILDVISLMPSSYMNPAAGNPFGKAGYLRLQASGGDTVLQYDMDGAAGSAYGFRTMATLKGVAPASLVAANFTQGIDPAGSESGLVLTGGAGNDTLTGGLVDDVIDGASGNDIINGRPGNDKLLGGAGNDSLVGEEGNDELFGGDGNDSLLGDAGNDRLDGGAGNDRLTDREGDNVLDGGDGDDNLDSTSTGRNQLSGGAGNDAIMAGAGNDTVLAGAGDDTILISAAFYGGANDNVVTVSAGDGDDVVRVLADPARATQVRLTLDGGSDTVEVNNPSASVLVTDFVAGAGGDKIDLRPMLGSGYDGPNPFASGAFRLLQRGIDTVLQFDADGNGPKQHQDVLRLQGLQADKLTAANFSGGISPDGASQGIVINGTGGSEQLAGTFLDDIINGADGSDSIQGKAGNDTIHGGADNDFLYGGKGDDLLFGDGGNDDLSGNEGNDELDGGDGDDILSEYQGNNILRGGTGNDTLSVSGEGNNRLYGGDGDDRLSGSATADTLLDGGAGNDYLYAGNMDVKANGRTMTLLGGDGDDLFSINFANTFKLDVVATGGAGRDTYTLSGAGAIAYQVTDFDSAADKIELKGVFENLLPQNIPANPFASGHMALVQVGADTWLQADKSGQVQSGNAAHTVLILKNVQADRLTAHHFVEGADPNAKSNAVMLAGDQFDNRLVGGGLDDVLSGAGGNDRLLGLNGADRLSGGDGNDALQGGAGDDMLDGGAGTDMAVFSGARSAYSVSQQGNGLVVTDTRGIDGIDTLVGIERLNFENGGLALDVEGVAGQIYRLYRAAFDRTPDSYGIGYWLNAMDGGASLTDVARSFVMSREFADLVGYAPTNAHLVEMLYQHVLHRSPEPAGAQYWTGILDNKQATTAEVLVNFSEGAENKAAVASLIAQGVEYWYPISI